MTAKMNRKGVIDDAMGEIKELLKNGVSQSKLEQARSVMLAISDDTALFNFENYPLPAKEDIYRTFLIYQQAEGDYALYVNASWPGQHSIPHDHGESWAIVTAVQGEETHELYTPVDGTTGNHEPLIQWCDTTIVEPGTGVALMPRAIHSISADGSNPLLHLHLYGKGFEYQGMRKSYIESLTAMRQFVLEDVGFIEDVR